MARKARQIALLRGIEEPFRGEFFAKCRERRKQFASASGLHLAANGLKSTALFVEADSASQAYACAVARLELHSKVVTLEHDTTNLGFFVLERKVPVTRAVRFETGDFAFDPYVGKLALQQGAGKCVDFRDRINAKILAFEFHESIVGDQVLVVDADAKEEISMAHRRVVITGAAGALGQAGAKHFAGLGDRLALLDQVEVQRQADYRGCCDLRDLEACRREVDGVVSRLEGIDVLLSVAGGFEMGEPVYSTESDLWQRMFDINLWTMVNMVQAVVPVMRRQGSGKIVTIGARAALRGAARMGAYCASKSAVVRVTESLADELKEEGINVNCIMPSIIDTPRNRMDMPDADFTRWVAPQRIADVMEFLVSDAASDLHGVALAVDGRA